MPDNYMVSVQLGILGGAHNTISGCHDLGTFFGAQINPTVKRFDLGYRMNSVAEFTGDNHGFGGRAVGDVVVQNTFLLHTQRYHFYPRGEGRFLVLPGDCKLRGIIIFYGIIRVLIQIVIRRIIHGIDHFFDAHETRANF